MATNLVSDYEKMADSIKKYGGFYIGRYELTANGSKVGAPLTNQTWYQLYKQCKNLTVDETKSMVRMIWGCQWDATCLWLKNTGININDSSSYGNYTGSKKNTGSSETYKTNNIYNMARKCV